MDPIYTNEKKRKAYKISYAGASSFVRAVIQNVCKFNYSFKEILAVQKSR